MGKGIHADAPLNEVTHIATELGARGAELWRLTLSCGHTVVRPKRPITPRNILEPIERKLAPQHARCIFCTL